MKQPRIKEKVSLITIKKASLLFIGLLFVSISVAGTLPYQKVLAGGDSRIGNCTAAPDERSKNECLAQLEQGAIEACRGDADQEGCKNRWKTGSANAATPQYMEDGDCKDPNVSASNCGIIGYLVIFINVLSALAGIVIIGSIVYAGILYSASGSDPQKVSAAKDRIRNAFIALIVFIFGYAILNYLVPGGVL